MDYSRVFAMKRERENRIKRICPSIPYSSGIYVFYRTDEAGINRAYCGQAVNLCERCASHLGEYDHIALSLKKHKFYSESNPTGWKLSYRTCRKDELDQKEIETIRERKITVKLSDADCDRLARKCGEHGLTIGELIENFVGDLVGGTYSNGSDERDYADQWFERCWFGMFPEPTLLNHLLNFGYEPEHYLDMLENVETIKSDIEITKQNIAEPSDEWKDIVYHKYNDDRTSYECVPCYNSVDEYIASEKEDLESYKADLEEALEELNDMREDWKPEKEPNMDEEIELIKKWVKEREDFINE